MEEMDRVYIRLSELCLVGFSNWTPIVVFRCWSFFSTSSVVVLSSEAVCGSVVAWVFYVIISLIATTEIDISDYFYYLASGDILMCLVVHNRCKL